MKLDLGNPVGLRRVDLGAGLWGTLGDNLLVNLEDNLWDSLWFSLRDNLRANLGDSVEERG